MATDTAKTENRADMVRKALEARKQPEGAELPAAPKKGFSLFRVPKQIYQASGQPLSVLSRLFGSKGNLSGDVMEGEVGKKDPRFATKALEMIEQSRLERLKPHEATIGPNPQAGGPGVNPFEWMKEANRQLKIQRMGTTQRPEEI